MKTCLPDRFLFTGRERIKEWRVYDFRNRHYLPELGRFIQPDPKEFEAGDYNLYRYCHNDPVNHSDPTGMIMSMGEAMIRYCDGQMSSDDLKMSQKGGTVGQIFGDSRNSSTRHPVWYQNEANSNRK
jgi:RHS repeat-associated protein